MSTNESTARPGAAQRQDSAASSASSLTPSQTINAKNQAKNGRNNKGSKRNNAQKQTAPPPRASNTEQNDSQQPKHTLSKNRRRRNKAKPKQPPLPSETTTEAVPMTATTDKQQHPQQKHNDIKPSQAQNKKKKRNQNRQRQKNKARRFPWRSQIPELAVDPITLDPLDQLPYPPFALAADEPYDPVPEWPVLPTTIGEGHGDGSGGATNTGDSQEDEARRQQRILEEQWGKKLSVASSAPAEAETETEKPPPPEDRPYNLYDGRALAYYMVSQLQFIDPLNRRDVTRDELVNLDRYLRRHGFHNLNVTEAYDAKGVTLSTAGATAATAGGRAQILQQEAAVLLQALFGGHSVSAVREPRGTNATPNALAQQYQAYEAQAQPQQRPVGTSASHPETDMGIYGDDAGILVIDDDLNPGLRGDAPAFVPAEAEPNEFPSLGNTTGTLWSASHIAARHNHASRLRAQEFPSLSATAASSSAAASSSITNTADTKKTTTRNLPKTNTLAKISGVVKVTTAEEKRRQWEAREAMKRKAALSNLTFGSTAVLPTSTASASSSLLTPPTMGSATQPTEGQVERNRALADALGVVPSTVRRETINSGWARPTDPLKEFGEELQATIYPDALILQARERLPLVLKMEKKWKIFLQDDKSASLPLQPMDRASRTFVHHYSDFWFLHTESFDLEPNRYIHCVKTRETMAPYPLLSVAVRQWKGPRPFLTEHAMQQTSGQATRQGIGGTMVPTRNIPGPPPRAPLSLRPPSVATAVPVTQAEAFSLSGAKPLTEEEKASARFDSLAPQRPKLQLQPRTTPVDLPPFEASEAAAASTSFDVQEHLRRQQERIQEKARQEQAAVDAKRRALEAAFASDSEEEGRVSSDSSDEWVEQTPVFQGDDEE